MDKPEISRRKLLTGFATAGGAGTVIGTGTSALFSDTETFTNNSITASASVAGEVNLDLSLQGQSSGSKYTFDLTIPEDDANNPAYVWLRLAECPSSSFASVLSLSLGVDCDQDGTIDQYLIGDDSTKKAFSEVDQKFREGLPIDPDCETDIPGGQACLSLGESVSVILEISVGSGFNGDGELAFEFRGRQCRYNDGTVNPFPELSDSGDCPTATLGKAISFVAFCTDDKSTIDPKITSFVATDDDGDPTKVEWKETKDNGVNAIVLKAGQQCKIYTFENKATSGTVQSGLVDEGVSTECDPPDPCPSGKSVKLEYDGQKFEEES